MEQVTDVVFRHVIKKAGAPDIFYTEFANATGWVHAGSKGIGGRLIKTDDEHPIVAQIWGGQPGDLEQFAKHCAALGFDGIDINMGCPAKSAVKSGGAALIRQPSLATQAIAAAKSAGLPVSVKTRLGYSHIDEWQGWLTHLLQQDIATLTIHLRTKKEMSKVPAHWDLIPEIKALRDQIAPHTLLVINGDIKNRTEGEALAAQYGVDGIMIGRGVFTDPFAFGKNNEWGIRNGVKNSDMHQAGDPEGGASAETKSIDFGKDGTNSGAGHVPRPHEPASQAQLDGDIVLQAAHRQSSPAYSYLRTEGTTASADDDRSVEKQQQHKHKLISLLHYHLDLYDKYAPETGRPYETLKRFFKIYIRDFDGASDLREKLMHTKNTTEARQVLQNITLYDIMKR